MNTYKVSYQYATYSGSREIQAEDGESAIAKVKRILKQYMTLPMAYEQWDVEEV